MATTTPARAGSPDHAGPVTDFALIESQKENIRPLAGGRSAATLGVLFEKAEEADKVVQEGVVRLQADIDEAERRDREGEDMDEGVLDVLDVYNRYITFLIQHYPSSPARVLPHLESTTRRFVDDARFSQDARYLKLWTMYARQVERREEVWSFLESRRIGTGHAGFYEEWASALEGLGRKKKADDVYRLGLARRAAPLERLKNRHQSFLMRIMAPPSGDIPDDPPEAAASTRQRSILGQVASASASGSVSGATQGAPSLRGGSLSRNGAKMAIFSDSAAGTEQPETTPWDDFGTRDGRRKENTVESTPWKGETLKQGRAIAPRTPKLEVFTDGRDGGGSSSVHAADGVLGGLKPKAPLSEAEMLRADPLKNFDTADVQSTVPQIPSLPAPPSARKPPAKKQRRERDPGHVAPHIWECPTEGAETLVNGKTQRRMFDWAATFRGGEEWSFQEVRARKLGLLGKDWKEVKSWERGWHKAGSTTPVAKAPPPRAPSPTLNTKLANEEVMSLFNQTIHGGKVRDPDFSDDSDDDDGEEDDHVAALPTPLPPRQGISMMTPGGMVPPTPTPAPGRGMQEHAALNIFSSAMCDENAPAPAPKKVSIFADKNAGDENAGPSSRRHVLQDTPVRAPLSSRPLKSKFAVFEEEERTPAPRNVFASKPLAAKALSPVHEPEAYAEDNENACHNDNDENAYSENNNYEYADENAYDDDDRAHNLRRFDKFRTMTPIAERTIEFTMNTTRSRHTATGYSDDEEGPSAPPTTTTTATQSLAAVIEEDERSASARSDRSSLAREGELREELRESLRRESEGRRGSDHRRESGESRRVESRRESSESRRASESRRESGDRRDSGARRESGGSSRDTGSRLDSYTSPSRFELHDDTYHSGSIDTAAFGVPDGYTIHRNVENATTMMHRLDVVDHGDVSMSGGQDGDVSMAAPADVELPNPCNPADQAVINTLLQRVQPPVSALPLLVDRRDSSSNRLATLQKAAKVRSRRSSAASLRSSTAPTDDAYLLDLGTQYEICSKLGEGAFGAVFLGLDVVGRNAADDESDSDSNDDDDGTSNKFLVAIKVERPCALWEAVMLDRVHRRVSAELSASIIRPRGLHVFADESFLLLDYSSQGTLLNVVNKATVWGISAGTSGPSAPDELVALFFVVELLKLVEGLHAADIIHGDLKIDNFLVRLSPVPDAKAWDNQYSRTGDGGWAHKGVRLIDFGRAADLSLFPAGARQRFVADWQTDERDCVEMREGRPWSYETDYFGLAGIAYCLLFGKYIQTERTAEGRCKIDTALKRYWQMDLWNTLFDLLLNPAAHGAVPITAHLAGVRARIETFLEENCQKNGKSLKQLLKRIELRAMEGR